MGKTILAKELSSSGIPVYSAGREDDPWGFVPSSDLLFGEETIVISARGNIGFPRAPKSQPFVSTQTTIAISLHDSRHVPFLRYQLETADWPGMTSQTTIPMVTVRQVERIEVKLPPLKVQQRIVSEIEKQFTRLEAGLAGLRRVQTNLKRYRAAVLKSACEGSLVGTNVAWKKQRLAEVVVSIDQGWSPKCDSEPATTNETWAVIKTTAIQHLRFVDAENKRLPEKLKHRPNLELKTGDILITRAGPRSRVGVACLVRNTRPHLMLCDKAYRLRCDEKVVLPTFLELLLNNPETLDEVNKLKTGINDSGVNLTQKRFLELQVCIPPLAEQTRIVAEVERRISVIDELEAVATTNIQRATRLRQSILQRAFTGELVP